MEETQKAEMLRGMFAGATFQNTVVVGIAENGSKICYQDMNAEADAKKEEKMKSAKEEIMEYVGRLKPVVTENILDVYDELWQRILDLEEVKAAVYDRGRQHGTNFNRNFVANIIHMMVLDDMVVSGTNDVQITELLEPVKGKNHPVRGSLGVSPEIKVKRAVEGVFRELRMKVCES